MITSALASVCSVWKVLACLFFLLAALSKAAASSVVGVVVQLEVTLSCQHAKEAPTLVTCVKKGLTAILQNAPMLCAGFYAVYCATWAAEDETVNLRELSTPESLLRAAYMVGYYCWKSVCPVGLTVRLRVPDEGLLLLSNLRFGAPALAVGIGCIVLGVSYVLLLLRHSCWKSSVSAQRQHFLLQFLLLAYLVLLLPTLGVASTHVWSLAADRYCYIGMMCSTSTLIVLVAVILAERGWPDGLSTCSPLE